MATIAAEPVPTKKSRSRKALKQTNSSSNEANILASVISQPSPTQNAPPLEDSAGKENHESLSQPQSAKKTKKAGTKAKQQQQPQNQSVEKELQEMQEKLQQLRIEKEQTEELLKAREETLKMKEEELETRGKEQEKLQTELKKLQKMKEFKPTMTFPIVQSLREKELEKKDKKKKGCPQIKRPSPPYILWCKDQWNEIKKANPEAEFKETSIILGTKWKMVSAEEKKPYEEKYQAEKEAYLMQRKQEESANLKKEENEMMKIHKQEALQLLKKKEKTDNIIKKMKENCQKKKKILDPNKPKKPASSFLLFSKEARKNLLEERLGINNSTLNALISVKWKELSEVDKQTWNEKAAEANEAYKKELEEYNKSAAMKEENKNNPQQ
ncbi:hypothetical protein TEA_016041 [Camellia sinensis var. sinensis]|uniref:HMG box domain-containing protein n=1 Tax=Camellia sinensis var. sinensis TaxID=542762 RepID=A0A4S4EMJ4_CAMSN|nr:hypothetical protein TEA_016041 [Camellia sinensis var. sinensis]